MKDKILGILKDIQTRKEFTGSKYSLTANYEKLIDVNHESFSKTYRLEYYYLDENTESFVREKLDKIDEVTSFNFTFHIEVAMDKLFETMDEEVYWDGEWKNSQFIFYSGDDDKIKFEFISSGAWGRDFRMSKYLSEPDMESDERWAEIKFNEKDFNNLGTILDELVKLDKMLDEQYRNRKSIIDKLKNL